MGRAVIGKVTLTECAKCEGLWTDAATLQQICNDQEKQSAILGVATPLPVTAAQALEKVVYLACPVCAKLMNRVNFAKCSGVIVDVCRTHGTWFDKEELRRLVEFIRGGGVLRAREKEVEELERRKRSAEAVQNNRLMDHRTYGDSISWRGTGGEAVECGLTAAAEALMSIFD
jgi:Zn-finger nucleic acid-binding protein